MLDIRKYNKVIDAINAIINNKGIAEVKVEQWSAGSQITVVEQTRSMKAVVPHDNNGKDNQDG